MFPMGLGVRVAGACRRYFKEAMGPLSAWWIQGPTEGFMRGRSSAFVHQSLPSAVPRQWVWPLWTGLRRLFLRNEIEMLQPENG